MFAIHSLAPVRVRWRRTGSINSASKLLCFRSSNYLATHTLPSLDDPRALPAQEDSRRASTSPPNFQITSPSWTPACITLHLGLDRLLADLLSHPPARITRFLPIHRLQSVTESYIMSLDALSSELDCKICEYLCGDRRSLNALSRTSKYYRAIAEPVLYKEIELSGETDYTLNLLLVTLLDLNELALHISTLCWESWGQSGRPRSVYHTEA